MAMAGHASAEMYKWVDEKGVTQYGDRLPPEYSQKANTKLDKRGVATKKIERAMTPEEIKARDDEAERLKQEATKAKEQKRLDEIMLATYANESEIDLVRDRSLEPVDGKTLAARERANRPDETARPVVFDWKIAAEARSRRRLEDELREAVTAEQFALHYWPIVALDDDRISGAEALLRWKHPVRGLLGPYEFLAVAEEMGLIYEIGRWVLRESCNQLRTWNHGPAVSAPLTIAVSQPNGVIIDRSKCSSACSGTLD